MMVVSSKSLRHKMWTEITRCKYEREGQRYASDVTDAEWALIEPHMPVVKRLGRPRESGGPRGYDAAKKVKGRKRHIVTDTGGLLVGVEVHRADVQDRDGAVLVIEAIHQLFPWLRHLFADSVYNGPNLGDALVKFGKWTIEIVKRAADAAGFQLLPRRWVVERTLAWLNRNRRLAKDFEETLASAKAWVYIASVQLLIRRLV